MDCPADTGAIALDADSDGTFEVVPVDLTISDVASSKLRELFNSEPDELVLMVEVHRGGCSGFLYDMKLIERPDGEGNQFLEIDGIPIVVSDYDSTLLTGINIDYQDTLMGGGFKVENPNAGKSCSCGLSFG